MISNSNIGGQTAQQQNKLKDFDQILFNHHEDGQDVYRKYLGRIQIFNSDKNTKDLIDENNMGVYARPYVEKYYQISDPEGEDCYIKVRANIKKIISRHLKETKRVVEFYD